MPLEALPIEPAAGGETINGDVHVQQLKDAGGLFRTLVNLNVGSDTDSVGGLIFSFAAFLRFECPVPAGSRIDGVSVGLTANGVFTPPMSGMVGGFIKPQTLPTGRNWQEPAGVGGWINSNDVPFAEWDLGRERDPSVWWGGAPAFYGLIFANQPTNGADWSLGENIAAFSPVTGLVAQLQSYIDGNESLRGSGTVEGSIPVCFQLYKKFTEGQAHNQGFFSSDAANGFLRPVLHIDWTPARSSAATRIDARGATRPALDAKSYAAPTLIASSETRGALVSESRTSGSIYSAGRTSSALEAASRTLGAIEGESKTGEAISSAERTSTEVGASSATAAELAAQAETVPAVPPGGKTRPATEGEE